MYEYINGEIVEISPSYAIIEASQIGYFFNISVNTFELINKEKAVKLFVHQVLREDTNTLYGFANKQERETFRHLISVSGIGANTARLILSSLKTNDIARAISEGDVTTFKNVKGIGLKTAQRLIVDLKDKISTVGEAGDSLPFAATNHIAEEALAALIMLGFNKKNTQRVISNILKTNQNITLEDLVKQGIKQMSK